MLLTKVERRSQPLGVSSLLDRRSMVDLKTKVTFFRLQETWARRSQILLSFWLG